MWALGSPPAPKRGGTRLEVVAIDLSAAFRRALREQLLQAVVIRRLLRRGDSLSATALARLEAAFTTDHLPPRPW